MKHIRWGVLTYHTSAYCVHGRLQAGSLGLAGRPKGLQVTGRHTATQNEGLLTWPEMRMQHVCEATANIENPCAIHCEAPRIKSSWQLPIHANAGRGKGAWCTEVVAVRCITTDFSGNGQQHVFSKWQHRLHLRHEVVNAWFGLTITVKHVMHPL